MLRVGNEVNGAVGAVCGFLPLNFKVNTSLAWSKSTCSLHSRTRYDSVKKSLGLE